MEEVSEALKKKKDEEASQIWASIPPPASQCKTCMFAQKDTEYTVGAEMSVCDVYEMPDGKPTDILWDKAECEYHLERLYADSSKNNRE